MYLYGYFENEEKPKISLEAVRYLSRQLEEFLNIYEKEVYIDEDKDRETLRQLRMISEILKQERYDQLIVDPSMVIDFNDIGDNDYLPEYYPI